MKGNQVRYVLLALIALAIVGVIVRLVSPGGSDTTLSGLLPIERGLIDTVSISTSSTEARLVRSGDQWSINNRPAFTPKLNSLWEVISDFDGAQLVATNPENHERMGVDPAQGVEVIFFLGAAVQERFTLGSWSPSTDQCFIRRGNSDDVYAVNCDYPSILFDPEPDGWRNPVVIALSPDSLEAVTFRFPLQSDVPGSEAFTVDMTAPEPVLLTVDGTQPVDPFTFQAMWQALQALVSFDYATTEEIIGLDFDAPDATVLVKPRPGVQTPTQLLSLIRKVDGNYYARISVGGSAKAEDVFVIDGRIIDSFVRPSSAYIQPEGAVPSP
jgi:hypothetical protein